MTRQATYRTMSASTAPINGAERAIGMERNRSKIPVLASAASEAPMPTLAWKTAITMTPGTTSSM